MEGQVCSCILFPFSFLPVKGGMTSDWWHLEGKNPLTCLSPFKMSYHFVRGWPLRTTIFSGDRPVFSGQDRELHCAGCPSHILLFSLIGSRMLTCPSSSWFQTQERDSRAQLQYAQLYPLTILHWSSPMHTTTSNAHKHTRISSCCAPWIEEVPLKVGSVLLVVKGGPCFGQWNGWQLGSWEEKTSPGRLLDA